MSLMRGLLAVVAATVLVVSSVPSVVPTAVPRAYAQAQGSVEVNLRDLVGSEWFDYIGERTVTLARIPDMDPATTAGQEKLTELNVPELLADGVEFEKVRQAETSDGVARFDGLPVGVYYLSVLDSPTTQDRRVSYAPTVVVVSPGAMDREVKAKPQQVGVTAGVQTRCTASASPNVAAPGTTIIYDFTATAPNPSVDGTIGTYEITFDFSIGHTLASKFSGASLPSVTLNGGGDSHNLSQDTDFSWEVIDDSLIEFALTEAGRDQLADLRKVDPRASVEIRIQAKANDRGPWGTDSGRRVLGSLEATATLRTDGMNAARDGINVAQTSHVNIIDWETCFGTSGGNGNDSHGSDGSDKSGGSDGQLNGPLDGTSANAGDGRHGGEEGMNSHMDTDPHADSGKSQRNGARTRIGLASTGASVIGLTLLSLVLIGVGIVLSRRSRERDSRA